MRLFALTLLLALSFHFAVFAAGFEAPRPVVGGSPVAVTTDTAGNRYIGGSFAGTVDFDPGPGENIKTSVNGSRDGFVTRFNVDGSYGWTTTFGGNPGVFDDDRVLGIARQGSRIYATGIMQAPDAGFNGQTGQYASGGYADGFIFCLDADTGVPVQSFGTFGFVLVTGPSDQVCIGIELVGVDLYVAGTLQAHTTFHGGLGITSLNSSHDGFIAKFNKDTGVAAAAQIFGGSSDDGGAAVAVANGVAYFAGGFAGTDAGVGALGTISVSGGNSDAYVVALDAATLQPLATFDGDGVLTFGGTGDGEGISALAVNSGKLFASGGFTSSNAGFNGAGAAAAVGMADIFIFSVDAATGAPAASFGGDGIVTFGGSTQEYAGSAGLDVVNGFVYCVGPFQSTNAGFDGAGTFTSSGSYDVFIFSLSAINGQPNTLFSDDGFQQFGGTASDSVGHCIVRNGVLLLAGPFSSNNAGVGGTGTIDATNFGGYLLELDSQTGGDGLAPRIVNAVPNGGPLEGGTTVTIAGQRFADGCTVKFGDNAATQVTFGNNTTVTCVTPAGTAGKVDIVVTNPDSRTARFSNGFEYLTPPVITSALTASAVKNAPFMYTITAAGSEQISFNAINLPQGLEISAGVISGSPTVAGSAEITLSASNAIGTDTKILTLTISGAGAAPPVFSSAAQASPKVALVGSPVSFSTSATDADGDLVSYSWNFSDGASAAGASVSHTFSAAGTYVVFVIASDGEHEAGQFVLIVVNAGTSEGVFAVAKGAIKFNFKLANKDAMSFLGTVPVTVNANVAGSFVKFTVAQLTLGFLLDEKGKGGDKNSAFALSGLKKGIATKAPLQFKLACKNRDLFTPLAAAGFTNTNVPKPGVSIVVPVAFSINDVGYLNSVTMIYVAAQGKSGSAAKK